MTRTQQKRKKPLYWIYQRKPKAKKVSFPFAADDWGHVVHITFVNNSVDKMPCGEDRYEEFWAGKARYTEGDYEYALTTDGAEIREKRSICMGIREYLL